MYGEPMKIQLGSIYINRTKKYLLPIIKSYGQEFTSKISSVMKLGVGIGDFITNKMGLKHEKHLFLLIDVATNITEFSKVLEWFKNHPAYEDDYSFDVLHKGRLHMLVIKVPDNFLVTIDRFKTGEFSKMYTPEQIRELFSYKGNDKELAKTYNDVLKVLIKDHNYSLEFAKKIEKEFDIEFPEHKLPDNWELDLPMLVQEEFFNYKQEQDGCKTQIQTE